MKKKILSALLALTMVTAMPMSAVLADETLPTDSITSGQETSDSEAPVEGNENTVEDVTTENSTEETPIDEENATKDDLITLYAEDTRYIYNGLYYTISNNEITVIGHRDYIIDVRNITIPSEINNIPVTAIGKSAFSDCTYLTDVVISEGVTKIDDSAFSNCKDLTSITIPDTITYIGNNAFYYCYKLTSINIPDNVTYIGSGAFDHCEGITSIHIPSKITSINMDTFMCCRGLTSINIPDNVTSIGLDAFMGCESLTNITISKGVSSIIDGALWDCPNLTSINVSNENQIYSSENGVLFNKDRTELLCYPSGKSGTYVIPYSVAQIGTYAFLDCRNLTNITIQNNVTRICVGAFSGCTSLTSMKIPNSVTLVQDYAFSGCSNLTSITIPSSVTEIPDAFIACTELKDVYYGGSENDWEAVDIGVNIDCLLNATVHYNSTGQDISGKCGDNAYWKFENGTLTISGTGDMDSYSNVDYYTTVPWYKYFTDIKSIVVEEGITSVGLFNFSELENLTNVKLPDSINSIKAVAFYCCKSLKNISLPPNISTISYDCFARCSSLESITIPDGVTEIEAFAFHNSGLKSVTLPKSVTSIFDEAFSECNSLTDVYYTGSKSDWEAISIGDDNEALLNATIHYNSTGPDDGESIIGTLRTTDGCKIIWQAYYKPDGTEQPKNVKLTIAVMNADDTEEELYLYNEAVENGFPFPWEMEPYNIQKSAITELVIHGESNKKLCTISGMFKDYTNLQKATFTNVSSIDSYTFDGCTNLRDLRFYEGSSETIGSGAFRNCIKLDYITLDEKIKYIGANAFQNCKSLGVITLQKEVTNIGKDAFDGCNNIMIRCYYQSVAHKYAEENGIKFNLIDPPKTLLPFYSPLGDKTTYWDIDWDWDLFNLPTTKYDSRLAAFGISISAATEDKSSQRAINMLKNDLGFDKYHQDNYGAEDNTFDPAVVFGYKKFSRIGKDDEHIFVIAIRGTTSDGDAKTDIVPGGFDVGAINTNSRFKEFMRACGVSEYDLKENGKIFITGHSLGGAVASILGNTLSEKYGIDNVFSYTFASPKTRELNFDSVKKNIHNIINNKDKVSKVGWLPFRYGHTYDSINLNSMKNDSSYCNIYEELAGITIQETDDVSIKIGIFNVSLGMHHVEVYAAYVFAGYNPKTNTKTCKTIKIKCPVDVEVYDANNQLVGKIINNICSDAIDDDMLYFYVQDDAKYVVLMDDGDYTLKLIGTDTGTMDYTVYEVNMGTNEIVAEKNFKNVSLSNDKEFTSYVSVWDKTDLTINSSEKIDTPEVPLYVIDDKGEPEKEVIPDGNGTEVPINNDNKPTTPDDNNKPTTPDTPSKPTVPDNGESTSNTNTSMSTVAPFGGTNTESMTVKTENKVTGKTSKAVAKKTGSSVTIKLGTENNGYYANVYTADDEYICSAIIENGRVKFTVSDDAKLKIVIDTIAYGEDVSSAAGVSEDSEPVNIPYSSIIVIIAVFGIYINESRKHSA